MITLCGTQTSRWPPIIPFFQSHHLVLSFLTLTWVYSVWSVVYSRNDGMSTIRLDFKRLSFPFRVRSLGRFLTFCLCLLCLSLPLPLCFLWGKPATMWWRHSGSLQRSPYIKLLRLPTTMQIKEPLLEITGNMILIWFM